MNDGVTKNVQTPAEAGDGTGDRVLLLVRGDRDRELLADRLGDRTAVVGDPEAAELPGFDLCLVDTATYPKVVETLRDRKDATATYLPVLLILGPGDSEAAAREVAELPDDVLTVPTSEAVFEARVDSLLRARRQSVELEARREELALYRRAMDHASQGITIADASDDQPLTYINDAFCEITGYDREEVLGRNCRFLQGPGTAEEPVRRMSEAIDAGDSVTVELKNYHKNGDAFWNHLEISPVYEDGELTHFLGFQQDVTDRKRMEERLREETETLERLLETSPVGIAVLNPEGEIVRANQTAEQVLGLERSEVLGRPFDAPDWEIVDENGEPIPVADLPFSRVMETGETVTGYEHAIRVDGEERWLSINAAPLTDGNGTTVGVVNSLEDVTERRAQEAALERERERFRTLAETASDAILTIDTDGIVRYANSAVERVFGYEPDAVIGESLTMLMPDRFQNRHEASMAQYLRTGEPSIDWTSIRFTGRHAEGHEVPLSVSFAEYEVGGEHRFTGIIRDVTEAVERERELERTVDLFERSQSIASVGGWEIDPETLSVLWTEEVYEILGRPVGEEPPLAEALDVYHPEDQPVIERAIEAALEGHEPIDEQVRVQRPDGEVRWVRVLGEPELEGGEVVTLRGAFQDITERRVREQERERLVRLFEKVQDLATVGAWEWDADAEQVDATEGARRIYEIDLDTEFDAEQLVSAYHPGDREEIREATTEAFETGEPFDMELRLDTDDEAQQWIHLHGAPQYEDGEITNLYGTVQDITQQKSLEGELREEKETLEQLFSTTPLGILVLDTDGTIVRANESARDVLHTDQERIVGRAFDDQTWGIFDTDGQEIPAAELPYSQVLQTGEPVYGYEHGIEATADESVWLSISAAPLTGADGEITGVIATVEDVSERVERERELEHYETVLDTVPEGAWILDAEQRIVFVNQEVLDTMNAEEGDLLGQPIDWFRETVFPDDEAFQEYADHVAAVLAGERTEAEITFDLPLADGLAVIEITVVPLEEDGEVTGVVGLARNITDRIERQQELERTLDLLDRTEEIADVGGWEYDIERNELFWTEQVYAIHELDPDTEVDLERAIELYHPEDRPVLRAAFERAIETGEPYDRELRIKRPDGETRWVRTQGEAGTVDGRRVIRGTIQDIHQRKQREQELEQTVDQLRQTRDIADVSGWEYDPVTGEFDWEERVWDIYGLPRSFEPTEERLIQQHHPDDRELVIEVMRRAILSHESFDIETRLDTEPVRWLEITGEPQVEGRRTTSVRGVVRNITDRKRREQFLERYERIVETASDPIYTLDEGLNFTLVNGAVAGLTADQELSLIGSHVSEVFGETHAERLADATTKLVGEGQDRTTIETTVSGPEGNERRYQTIITTKAGKGPFQGVVCVSRDITELQERERRLSVLDRVLRHNLRNKMNVVLAQAAMALDATDDDVVAEAVADIEDAAQELHRLAEDARQFHGTLDPSTDERVAPMEVDEHAKHVAEEAALSYTDVSVEAEIEAVPPALAQPELELVLSELVDNAATHGGSWVGVSVTTEDDEVVVRVADDGPGIPDVERRALQAGLESPLEHTTGLGLWFVRWTATNSGGSFEIADREPTGTTVELRLPIAQDEDPY